MFRSRLGAVAVVGAVLVSGAVGLSFLFPHNSVVVDADKRELIIVPRDADAMCPWRNPETDLAALFPGKITYKQELVALSRHRLEILRRLGNGVPLESNALYVYPVQSDGKERGTIVVRRFAGEYGSIECVVALNLSNTILGVRLQRQREPPIVAGFLESKVWLDTFRGKGADSVFVPGQDLPNPPPAARQSAQAMASAIRSVLVEKTIAEANGEKGVPVL